MSDQEEPLRVALLLNGTSVPGWAYDALDHMLTHTNTEISLLVLRQSDGESGTAKTFLSDALEDGLWGLVMLSQRLSAVIDKPHYWKYQDVRTLEGVGGAKQITCSPIEQGAYRTAFPDDVSEQVATESDVALLFGYGIITGDILTAPEYGVLSFHHGDIRTYRGQPAGLWEYLAGEDEVGVTVQRLTKELDAGEIVSFSSINVSDAYTWQTIRSRMYAASEPMLTEAMQKLKDKNFRSEKPDKRGSLNKTPGFRAALIYIIKNIIGRVQKYLNSFIT